MYDLIIVGAGPAGIALAYETLVKNREKNILILEKSGNICQTIKLYYKDGKRVDKDFKGIKTEIRGNIPFEDCTKEKTLELFETLVKEKNIQIKFWSEVESIKKLEDRFVVTTAEDIYQCKNYVISIGKMGKPNKPSYTLPATLNKVINFNINSVINGEKVLVVGGGNSAGEYAVDLSERTDITLCYRKPEFIRLNEINLKNVETANEMGKLQLKMGTDIIKLEDENGKVKVYFTNDEIEIYDRVIYAIGGSTPVDFLQKCGVVVDDDTIPTFDENMETNVNGIFIAGDICSKNGASIVTALNQAKKIADYLA